MNASRAPLVLFLLAFASRVALLTAAALYTGTPWRNLAMLYDGHIYALISKSSPFLYQGIHEFFPVFRDSSYFTGWFPVYPALIWAADLLIGETRLAALATSLFAGSLAVVLFHRLAARTTTRPLAAALIFCVLPPTWLLTGSVAFVEPVFLCLVIAAFDYALQGRFLPSVILGGLAAITQKSGFLLFPILAAAALTRRPGDPRLAARYALCLPPLALLAAYQAVLFDDPLMLTRVQGEVYSGSVWALPFQSLLQGLLSPVQMARGDFWLRKALIALSALFYTTVFICAWLRRDRVNQALLAWLGVVLAFVICLGKASYEPFARYMLLAAPPAILLAVEMARLKTGTAFFAAWAVALPLSIAHGARDASSAAELLLRVWPAGYFDALSERLDRSSRP